MNLLSVYINILIVGSDFFVIKLLTAVTADEDHGCLPTILIVANFAIKLLTGVTAAEDHGCLRQTPLTRGCGSGSIDVEGVAPLRRPVATAGPLRRQNKIFI